MIQTLISHASNFVFRAAFTIDNWIGLPEKATESLLFRTTWRKHLPTKVETAPALWIHGASVGELEDVAAFFLDSQILEKSGYHPSQVIITSSSVSTMSRLNQWRALNLFRYVGPLPPENSQEADAFFSLLNPELLLLSHNDIWPNLYGRVLKKLRRGVIWFPEASPTQKFLVETFLMPHIRLTAVRQEKFEGYFVGNTRIDRICNRIQLAKSKPHVLSSHLQESKLPKNNYALNLIVGSGHVQDVQILSQAIDMLSKDDQDKINVVIIPHEAKNTHVVGHMKAIMPSATILTIEGVLLEAYKDFDLALIGGGFRSGLHSILEPALWQLPIICGPLTSKQSFTDQLTLHQQLKIVSRPDQLKSILWNCLHQSDELNSWKALAANSAHGLKKHCGASDRLAQAIASLGKETST